MYKNLIVLILFNLIISYNFKSLISDTYSNKISTDQNLSENKNLKNKELNSTQSKSQGFKMYSSEESTQRQNFLSAKGLGKKEISKTIKNLKDEMEDDNQAIEGFFKSNKGTPIKVLNDTITEFKSSFINKYRMIDLLEDIYN